MPAVTYLSEYEVSKYRVVADKDCNEVLQDLRKLTGEDWVIQVQPLPVWRRGWHGFQRQVGTKDFYTLYADCHGEWQIINLVTPNGGSVFCGASREDVMNFMLGYLAGVHATKIAKAA